MFRPVLPWMMRFGKLGVYAICPTPICPLCASLSLGIVCFQGPRDTDAPAKILQCYEGVGLLLHGVNFHKICRFTDEYLTVGVPLIGVYRRKKCIRVKLIV